MISEWRSDPGREGILVFPTHGLCGLGANSIIYRSHPPPGFAIKRRPAHQPLLVLSIHDMDRVVRTVPDYAEVLLGLWPGGITVIFKAGERVPADRRNGQDWRARAGTSGGEGAGRAVRRPRHRNQRQPVRLSGTGQGDGIRDPEISRQVDMVLDGGTLAGGSRSTLVDVTCWPVRVLREGVVRRPSMTF